MRWMFLRNPDNKFYTVGNGLTIHPKDVNISQKESPAAVFCRQQHTNFTAETSLRYMPRTQKDLAGVVLLQNERFNFVFGKTLRDGQPVVTLTKSEKEQSVIASAPLSADKDNQPLRLKIEGHGRYYDFYYAEGNAAWQTLARGVDAVNLSTGKSGGFIGVCIGLYATCNNN